jgi:hypothetical protein
VHGAGAAALAGVAARGPAVIYALGGGLGHLSRALVLARAIDAVAILHRAPGDGLAPDIDVPPGVRLIGVDAGWTPADLRACLAGLAQQAPVLAVDTFPAGVAHELDDALLSAFGHRVLVRRYLRPGAYDDEAALAARFDTVLVPYREAACEWDGEVGARAVHVGFLVRALAVEGVPDGVSEGVPDPLDLVIIGDAGRLPPGWRALLPERTRCVSGRFRALPAARRYLGAGAGHNLTYELHEAGVRFALMPCERRYDDQFRRADRLGAGVYTRDDLAGWLGGAPGRTGRVDDDPVRASEERVR